MSWKRYREWEGKSRVVAAYHSTNHPGVYYVTRDNDFDTYRLCYWPNKHKKIETVSLINSFEDEETALDALDERTNSE